MKKNKFRFVRNVAKGTVNKVAGGAKSVAKKFGWRLRRRRRRRKWFEEKTGLSSDELRETRDASGKIPSIDQVFAEEYDTQVKSLMENLHKEIEQEIASSK